MNQQHSLPARQSTAELRPTTPFCEPWLNDLRRRMGRTGTTTTLMGGTVISQEMARRIAEKRLTLERQITAKSTERQAVGVELAKLLAAFPTQDPGISAALRIEAYEDAIGTAPAWAIREARGMIVRGEVAGIEKQFAPSPPQLAMIVNEVLKPLRNDLATLAALETIPPIGFTDLPFLPPAGA